MRASIFNILRKLLAIGALSLCGAHSASAAETMKLGCNSYNPLETMFSDVCWSGMFPIRLAGATMVSGKSGVPQDASNKIICACGGDLKKGKLPRIGFTVGFWAHSTIDVTRRPYCLPSLGGIELPVATSPFVWRGQPGRNRWAHGVRQLGALRAPDHLHVAFA